MLTDFQMVRLKRWDFEMEKQMGFQMVILKLTGFVKETLMDL